MRAATISQLRQVRLGPETWGWIAVGFLLLGCAAYLFATGMAFVTRQWSDPEYSHGWLIPVVTLFILWNRREAILATAGSGGAWFGTIITAAALVMLILSDMAFVQRGPYLAFILLLTGLGIAAVGWRAMRYAWIPLLFLLFAFPLPGSVYVPLSTGLQFISSKLGAAILNSLGVSVFLDGNIIDLGIYKLQVAEACSGLRYLFPLASFGFLCAWLYNAPLWARALVLVATIPITIVTNSARIALTGLFVEHGSIELAEGFMHLFEGWVIFIIALFILFALMWLLGWLTGRARRFADLLDFDRLAGGPVLPRPPAGRPALAVSLPLVACTGLMIATVLAHGPLTAREQTIPARPGLVTFPLRFADWQGQPHVVTEQNVLRALGATDYLLADYVHAGSGEPPVNLWVAYYDEQLGNAAIHSPKDCLPGGGWEYVSLASVPSPVTTAAGQPFEINRGVIAQGLEQMVIYYWLDIRGRQITNDATLKIYNLWDSYSMGRSDGALVRVMTPVRNGEPVEAADTRIQDFIKNMYPALEPHVGA
jgi:exosortase D (VPLPA-CTERM-specific)